METGSWSRWHPERLFEMGESVESTVAECPERWEWPVWWPCDASLLLFPVMSLVVKVPCYTCLQIIVYPCRCTPINTQMFHFRYIRKKTNQTKPEQSTPTKYVHIWKMWFLASCLKSPAKNDDLILSSVWEATKQGIQKAEPALCTNSVTSIMVHSVGQTFWEAGRAKDYFSLAVHQMVTLMFELHSVSFHLYQVKVMISEEFCCIFRVFIKQGGSSVPCDVTKG